MLRPEPIDFKTAFFTDDLDILRETNGFRIVPRFSVNNDQIQALINNQIFSYGIQIQCRSTYYRTIEYIVDNKDIFIPGGKVHNLVEICPCIVALKDLAPYDIEDFVPPFKLESVKVYSGDAIGIGTNRTFRAYYKADEAKKASSLITVREDKGIERIRVDLDQPNIYVYLPQDQHNLYKELGGTATADQLTILMGLIYVPAITQAITEMTVEGDSEYEGHPWYTSLMASLDKLAEGDPDKIESLIDNPFETAQRLLGDNTKSTLQILMNRDW